MPNDQQDPRFHFQPKQPPKTHYQNQPQLTWHQPPVQPQATYTYAEFDLDKKRWICPVAPLVTSTPLPEVEPSEEELVKNSVSHKAHQNRPYFLQNGHNY